MSTRLCTPGGTRRASKSASTRTRRPNTIFVCSFPTRVMHSTYELLQEPLALPQRSAAFGERSFIGSILDLDAHRAVVAGVGQRGKQRAPGDIAQARQLRRVPAQPHDADFIQLRRVHARVLGVEMNDALAELANAGHAIDVLPDEVRRIEIEPPARTRNLLEHRPPYRRRGCQIRPAGPFVVREQHWTILD